MKTEFFDYELPGDLIVQQPIADRVGSRLLVFTRSTGEVIDSAFGQIGDFLKPGDCLVVNDTKVLAARFFARRKTGGKLEGLFIRVAGGSAWEVLLKGAGKLKLAEEIIIKNREGEDFCSGRILEKKEEGRCLIEIEADGDFGMVLERIGFTPLPPYIKRGADSGQDMIDKGRYQTVYAKSEGAIAAPTAGLHFTDELMGQLKAGGVRFAYVTLHVGEGTFKPVTSENLEEHKMHKEWFCIDEENARIINEAKGEGGRIIAVGTTSVRVLETAGEKGVVSAGSGETELFIKPGYNFRIVDAMVTNFHLPRSTLLALVGAFTGLDEIKRIYRHAIEQRYRFYSYGDAMLIV